MDGAVLDCQGDVLEHRYLGKRLRDVFRADRGQRFSSGWALQFVAESTSDTGRTRITPGLPTRGAKRLSGLEIFRACSNRPKGVEKNSPGLQAWGPIKSRTQSNCPLSHLSTPGRKFCCR
jgi:hypothetical protein